MSDLRTDIQNAIEDAACAHAANHFREDAVRIDACTECQVNAVMAVVEQRLWRARNLINGRCRYCGTNVDGGGLHRMGCRHYVGPLEHGWINMRSNGIFGGVEHDCSCGRSVRVGGMAGIDGEPVCPDVDHAWRGPRLEGPA